MGGSVIYIVEVEEWGPRAHMHLTLLAPFYKHFLCSIDQKMFNPEVGAGSNSLMVQFVQESIMGDSVESLRGI